MDDRLIDLSCIFNLTDYDKSLKLIYDINLITIPQNRGIKSSLGCSYGIDYVVLKIKERNKFIDHFEPVEPPIFFSLPVGNNIVQLKTLPDIALLGISSVGLWIPPLAAVVGAVVYLVLRTRFGCKLWTRFGS